jgi:hypothetical protein
LVESGVEAEVGKVLAEPLGAGVHVAAMLRLGGHAGKTDEGFEFVNELTAMRRDVLGNG